MRRWTLPWAGPLHTDCGSTQPAWLLKPHTHRKTAFHSRTSPAAQTGPHICSCVCGQAEPPGPCLAFPAEQKFKAHLRKTHEGCQLSFSSLEFLRLTSGRVFGGLAFVVR